MAARRAGRATVPALVAVVLLAQFAGVTAADHGGRPIGALLECERPGVSPPRCTSVANNLWHFVYFDASLTEGLASSLRDTIVEDYDATDLNARVQRRLTTDTDVVAYSQDYGDNGAAGWVYCPPDAPQGINDSGDRWCKRQELHLNINFRYDAFFGDDPSRDHITCHELGHTIGLRHWGNPPQSAGPAAATCMNGNTPNGPAGLHQIDVDHVNTYPYEAPRRPRSFPLLRVPGRPSIPRLIAASGTVGQATEAEAFSSLGELTRSADAVVRGRAVDVAPGRVFGDPSRAALHYAAVTLRVDDLTAGSLPRGHRAELILELPLFDGPASLERLRADLGGEAVFFLRSKGESARAAGLPRGQALADEPYYRLVTFHAWLADDRGQVVVSPEAPAYLASLGGLRFADAITLVRGSAR